MEKYRAEILAARDDDRDITSFGTVHSMKELLIKKFQAVMAGFDTIIICEY